MVAAAHDEKLLQDMVKNAVHFGHKPSKWNPKMKKYIFGKHSGVHVFDLNQTAQALQTAAEFVKEAAKEKKTILFVGTKAQAIQVMTKTAVACDMPYITHKWVPGLLTNFSTIKKRIKYLKELKEQEEAGELEKYTKKEALGIKKTVAKLEASLGGVQKMEKRPDVVFVADVVRDNIAVEEAFKLGIPIVGIVDSNANPSQITYPIPANDDALKAIEFLVTYIGEAIGMKK